MRVGDANARTITNNTSSTASAENVKIPNVAGQAKKQTKQSESIAANKNTVIGLNGLQSL